MVRVALFWNGDGSDVALSIINATTPNAVALLEMPSTAKPLTKVKDNVFEVTLDLEEGLYYYLFYVDGAWQ